MHRHTGDRDGNVAIHRAKAGEADDFVVGGSAVHEVFLGGSEEPMYELYQLMPLRSRAIIHDFVTKRNILLNRYQPTSGMPLKRIRPRYKPFFRLRAIWIAIKQISAPLGR